MSKASSSIVAIQSNTIRLLTEKEVSSLIRKSVAWLQQDRRNERKIPFRRIGRHILYNEVDVLNFIEKHLLQTSTNKAAVTSPKKTSEIQGI
jgi:hypothetical protein